MDNLRYIKLFFGAVSIIVAILYFINTFSSISGLDLLFAKLFLGFLMIADSIILFYDSLKLYKYRTRYKMLAIITSVMLFILGIVPVLVSYNALNFASFIATLTINTGFMILVLLFAGIYLVLSYF
mgnify:CR=1 FL=1